MPQDHSFDVVSQLDHQELKNAIQQATKEILSRYDFKGSKAEIELNEQVLSILAEDDQRVKAVIAVLEGKLVKRGIPLDALSFGPTRDASGTMRRTEITLQEGIPTEKAREIVKVVKQLKLKAQVAIQGDQVRVTAKKIDDLQAVMAALKSADLGIHMDFKNYR